MRNRIKTMRKKKRRSMRTCPRMRRDGTSNVLYVLIGTQCFRFLTKKIPTVYSSPARLSASGLDAKDFSVMNCLVLANMVIAGDFVLGDDLPSTVIETLVKRRSGKRATPVTPQQPILAPMFQTPPPPENSLRTCLTYVQGLSPQFTPAEIIQLQVKLASGGDASSTATFIKLVQENTIPQTALVTLFRSML